MLPRTDTRGESRQPYHFNFKSFFLSDSIRSENIGRFQRRKLNKIEIKAKPSDVKKWRCVGSLNLRLLKSLDFRGDCCTANIGPKGWFPYDRRRSRIAESSAIVCDHMETHFCDRLRSCDRDRRRSQKIEPYAKKNTNIHFRFMALACEIKQREGK